MNAALAKFHTPEHYKKMQDARKKKREERLAAGIVQPKKAKAQCEKCNTPILRRSKKRGMLCVPCWKESVGIRTRRTKVVVEDQEQAFREWLDGDTQRHREQEALAQLPLVKCPEEKCRRFFHGTVYPHEHTEGYYYEREQKL